MSGRGPGSRIHLLAVAGLVAVCAAAATTQTQPPPAAPAAATDRPDFSGTWSLERSISTDPAQISFDPAGDRQPNTGGRGGFGGRSGRGYGGRNAGQGSGNGAVTLTPLEQQRLKALTSMLKSAASKLVISHHDPDFVVNDADDHTQFFQTSGTKNENYVGTMTVTSSTQWEGPRIVTRYEISSRLTLAYTYTLLPKTRELVLRIARRSSDRQSQGEQDVKLVYEHAAPKS
jgi:hypothetical protein